MTRAAPSTIRGKRVALRPIVESDVAAVQGWYSEAAATLAGLSRRPISHSKDLTSRLREARWQPQRQIWLLTEAQSGEAAGLLDFGLPETAEGWLTIAFLAVAKERRGRGLGGEAVLLLEEEAQQRGWAHRFRARIVPQNGLAIYFWLRLGYHALLSGQHPWDKEVVWMIRDSFT